jgi:Uma2 family endonuclease
METRSLAEAVLDPGVVSADLLYRITPDVYQGMTEHGLLTERDRVVLRDGLLVHEPANGAETNPADRLYRIPLDVYHEMARLGLLTKNDKAVLLDGLLVKKMTKGQPHVTSLLLVADALRGLAQVGWHVRTEAPLALPPGPSGHGSEPEPDVFVVRGAIRDYLTRHPGPADLALVVEVAESSVREDRAALALYARAGIPVAWIVNLNDGAVEVYTRPTGPVDPARYEDSTVYRRDDHLPVVVDGREVGQVAVRDLLP